MVACGSLEYRLLEPWIIKEKEKQERERRIKRDRPRVYEHEPSYNPLPKEKEEAPKRGVVKIDLSAGEEGYI